MNQTISILAHGAIGDGKSLDTRAIQSAIDTCTANGGGRVSVPQGRYVCGTVVLQSDVELHLEKGAVLVASTSRDDYLVPTVYEGCLNTVTYRGMIYAKGAQRISLTGEGKIFGEDLSFWNIAPPGAPGRRYRRADGRPMMVLFELCDEVLIEGVEFERSPIYAAWLIDCTDVLIRDVRVRHDLDGPNTDGFHISSCRRVRVEHCDFVTGDDSIAVDGNGRNHAHDITISNCTFRSDTCMVRLYTGIDTWMAKPAHGVVRNITITNCEVNDAAAVLNIAAQQHGEVSGVQVSGIAVNQDFPGVAVFLMTDAGRIADVTIDGLKGIGNGFASMVGAEGDVIENITLRNIDFQIREVDKIYKDGFPTPLFSCWIYRQAPSNFYARNVKGLTLDHISIRWADGRTYLPALDFEGVSELRIGDFLAEGFNEAREMPPFQVHEWVRDQRNPIIVPGPESYDIAGCASPCAIARDGEYFLFYTGADARGIERICLATAPVNDLSSWTKHGPILDPGREGGFDGHGCAQPVVHRFGGRWHLYYTGRSSHDGREAPPDSAIGLAVSDDLRTWQRHTGGPVLTGKGFALTPVCHGVETGGGIVEIPQVDGRVLYRMHYTLHAESPGERAAAQAKYSVISHSFDGVCWVNQMPALKPRPEDGDEDIATMGLHLWSISSGFRAIYAALGNRSGGFSLHEATSRDGLIWERGNPGGNLALAATGTGWESEEVGHPDVTEESGKLRLFYSGNGGIGTALAEKLTGA